MCELFPPEIIAQLCRNSAATRAIRCICRSFRGLTAVTKWPVSLRYGDAFGGRTTTPGYVAARSVGNTSILFAPWTIIIDGADGVHVNYFSVMRRFALELTLMGGGDVLMPSGYKMTWLNNKPKLRKRHDLWVSQLSGTTVVETAHEFNETLNELGVISGNHGYRAIFVYHSEARAARLSV